MILNVLKRKLDPWKGLLLTSGGISAGILLLSLSGVFQVVEWGVLDWFFRLRPAEDPDPRIVIVEIDEDLISHFEEWPVSDQNLLKILEAVDAQKPRIIGVDLYRNLPVAQGYSQLKTFYQNTPHLIGIEKQAGQPVSPDPTLAQLGQVAMADLVVDGDNRVRRALLSMEVGSGEPSVLPPSQDPSTSPDAEPTIKYGLATYLALAYLDQQGIHPQQAPNSSDLLLGNARFEAWTAHSGGYRLQELGGYQTLLNYRSGSQPFVTVSALDVLNGHVSPKLLQDKIVLIGATAQSLNDFFLTPFNSDPVQRVRPMPGVIVHAHIASQILSAALDHRTLLRSLPEPLEWAWVMFWSFSGAALTWQLIQSDLLRRSLTPGWLVVIGVAGGSGVLMGTGFLAFLGGWWLPMAIPTMALGLAAFVMAGYHHQVLDRIARVDELTQIANRRYFDFYLHRQLLQKGRVALLLCDVDFFKQYNDTYGHLAGDGCLQEVARALRRSVRRTDVVARYGGEEFAVILPNADEDLAQKIGERIRQEVFDRQLPHSGSKVAPVVTLSCGVATALSGANVVPEGLIQQADTALYQAKQQGRNRVMLLTPSPTPTDAATPDTVMSTATPSTAAPPTATSPSTPPAEPSRSTLQPQEPQSHASQP